MLRDRFRIHYPCVERHILRILVKPLVHRIIVPDSLGILHRSKRLVEAEKVIVAEVIPEMSRERSSGLAQLLSEKEKTARAPVIVVSDIPVVSSVGGVALIIFFRICLEIREFIE